MKPKAKQEHFEILENVTTLEDAAKMVHRDPNTVSYAIDAGHIAHLRRGRIVLVCIPSLIEYYSRSRQ
jgi:hypothetical protein